MDRGAISSWIPKDAAHNTLKRLLQIPYEAATTNRCTGHGLRRYFLLDKMDGQKSTTD